MTIPKTERENFATAVESAIATGQSAEHCAEQVAQAKVALVSIGALMTRPFVSASANGHQLEPDQADTWHEGVTVSVLGSSE
jgi:hypothetical protein